MPRLTGDRFRQRGAPITISVDGEDVPALAGESIAAAMTAAGKLTLRRDRDGRPRGLFCGMGVCFDCMVSIDGGSAQRACLTEARDGMRVGTQDYRTAVPDVPEKTASHLDDGDCDVLIVGAGPAGLAAAALLGDSDVAVVLVDERPSPGGQFYKQLASSYVAAGGDSADRQYADGRTLIDQAAGPSVQRLQGAVVWNAACTDDGFEVGVVQDGASRVFRSRYVLLATGAYEFGLPFPGWTLPGVMTTGAAQSLARSYRVGPSDRVLIAGNGPLNLQLACELLAGGVDVVAVAEAAPHPFPRRWRAGFDGFRRAPGLMRQGLSYLRTLRRHGVPLYFGHHIVRADGGERVRSAELAGIDAAGRPRDDRRLSYAVDTVCIGYGFQPSNELARLLGCAFDKRRSDWLTPRRDDDGRTSVPGLFLAGDGGVTNGAQVARAEGRLAAKAILGELGWPAGSDRDERRLRDRHLAFQRSLWSLFAASPTTLAFADADTILCRCENLTRGMLEDRVTAGATDLGALKRMTRAGMGRCQGRYCLPLLAALVEGVADAPTSAVDVPAPKGPLKPIPSAALAAEKPEWGGYRPVAVPSAIERKSVAEEDFADTDVLVIGAGVIGISAAYCLAKEGIDTLIVDRGQANGQASGGNAGSLHLQLLSFDFNAGDDTSPAIRTLPLQRDGIAEWQALERELAADFELKITGGLMVAEDAEGLAFLERKAAVERRYGIETGLLSQSELRARVPLISERMVGGALCPGEGKINPLLATPALLDAALAAGARFRPQTEVCELTHEDGRYHVGTSRGRVRANRVVNAAGGWSAEIAAHLGIDLPVRSAPQQMIVTEPAAPMVEQLLALAGRHLTMKQAANGNLIIGGGWFADYDSVLGWPKTLRESLEGNLWAACRVLPAVGGLNIIRSWAAVGVMIDGAPVIGEMPGYPGFFNAVGANGYTMGPLFGRIIAELIRTGQSSIDISPFAVERLAK